MYYVNRQCSQCLFVSTEDEPAFCEVEVDEDTGIERICIVCPKCNYAFYRDPEPEPQFNLKYKNYIQGVVAIQDDYNFTFLN